MGIGYILFKNTIGFRYIQPYPQLKPEKVTGLKYGLFSYFKTFHGRIWAGSQFINKEGIFLKLYMREIPILPYRSNSSRRNGSGGEFMI